jgi:uncharacterized membrane protein
LALGLALAGLAVMTSIPTAGEGYTEFYILGERGLAEETPREAVAGQAVEVRFGITNREGEENVYRVEVYQEGARIGEAGPYRLEDEEGMEAQLAFTPARGAKEARIVFLLFEDGREEAYRRLEVWMGLEALER